MSTRATYTIKQDRQDLHFYIHHDGYTQGAAEYFYLALSHGAGKGGMAEQFIRGNQNAMFTADPEAHGDTEYHYTLDTDGTLTQSHRNSNGLMRPIRTCKVWDFVNKNKDFSEGESVIAHDSNMIKPIHQIMKDAESRIDYLKRFTTHTGNCNWAIKVAIRLFTLVVVTVDEEAEAMPTREHDKGNLVGLAKAYINVLTVLEEMYRSIYQTQDQGEQANILAEIAKMVARL